MKYKCGRCGFKTSRKGDIKRHIKRVITCYPLLEDILPIILEEEESNKINCKYCKKDISELNIKRHELNCVTKNEKIIKEKDEEIKKLEQKIQLLENTTVINNITNNNIIININGYKKTSFEHLSDKQYNKAIGRLLMSVPQLIEDVHFNPKMPENHNIYISNIQNKYAMVYDGKNWETKDQERVINELISDHEYAMEEWLGGEGEKFPNAMEKFNKYLNIKEKDGAMKSMKDEIKLLLYNKRDMITNK